MKKLLALLMALTMCAGVVACGGGKDDDSSKNDGQSNSNSSSTLPGQTPGEPVEVGGEVSETEWAAAWNLGTNFTVIAKEAIAGDAEHEYEEQVGKRAGNLFETLSYVKDAQGNVLETDDSYYYEIDGETVYEYEKNDTYWTKEASEYYEVEDFAEFPLAEWFPETARTMSDFTYNTETERYEASELSVYSSKIYNVKLGFTTDGKKLAELSYEMRKTSGGGSVSQEGVAPTAAAATMVLSYTFTITYGTTTITLPTNVFGSDTNIGSMTAGEFEKGFSFGAEFTVVQTMTYADTSYEQYTNQRCGDIWKRTGTEFDAAGVEEPGNYPRYYEWTGEDTYNLYSPMVDMENMTLIGYDKAVNSGHFDAFMNDLYDAMALVEAVRDAKNYTYNADKDEYTCSALKVELYGGMIEATYANIVIKFNADKKITSITFDMEYQMPGNTMAVAVALTFTYGTGSINLPNNVQTGGNNVTDK